MGDLGAMRFENGCVERLEVVLVVRGEGAVTGEVALPRPAGLAVIIEDVLSRALCSRRSDWERR
jgi:hypothetical protein